MNVLLVGALLSSAAPAWAQATMSAGVLLTPDSIAPLTCRRLPLADSAGVAYVLAVFSDSVPRMLVATYDSTGVPRSLGVTAELATGNWGMLQQVTAEFISEDSVVMKASATDGDRIAADLHGEYKAEPLALRVGAAEQLRTLASWIWKRRCP